MSDKRINKNTYEKINEQAKQKLHAGAEPDASRSKMGIQEFLYAASPALLYTALSSAAYSVLADVWPGASDMMRQAVSLAVCLAYFAWRAAKEGIFWPAGGARSIYRYPASFCYAASVVMCGVACNYLIYLAGLKTASPGYRHVAEAFYGNGLFVEILALCVLGPIAEELVYRGFVLRRLQRQTGDRMAIVLSALLFGALHFNLVQGVYGFALGLLLAHIVCQTGSVWTAAAAHMASNLTSVLWTETRWLEFLDQEGTGMYVTTALCALLAGIFAGYGNRLAKRR